MEYKIVERDCDHCEYNKLLYQHGEIIGTSCSRWTCIEDEPKVDLDCALRD